MRTVILTAIAISLSLSAFSQNENQGIFKRFYNNQVRAKSEEKGLQVFAEINPQFFAYDGFGAGFGLEFSRFQTGFIFVKTKLTPTFRDAIFENAKNLDVPTLRGDQAVKHPFRLVKSQFVRIPGQRWRVQSELRQNP